MNKFIDMIKIFNYYINKPTDANNLKQHSTSNRWNCSNAKNYKFAGKNQDRKHRFNRKKMFTHCKELTVFEILCGTDFATSSLPMVNLISPPLKNISSLYLINQQYTGEEIHQSQPKSNHFSYDYTFHDLHNKIKNSEPSVLNLISLNEEFFIIKNPYYSTSSNSGEELCSMALNELCNQIYVEYDKLLNCIEKDWLMQSFVIEEFERKINTALQPLLEEEFIRNCHHWDKGTHLVDISRKLHIYAKEIEIYKMTDDCSKNLDSLKMKANLVSNIDDINNLKKELQEFNSKRSKIAEAEPKLPANIAELVLLSIKLKKTKGAIATAERKLGLKESELCLNTMKEYELDTKTHHDLIEDIKIVEKHNIVSINELNLTPNMSNDNYDIANQHLESLNDMQHNFETDNNDLREGENYCTNISNLIEEANLEVNLSEIGIFIKKEETLQSYNEKLTSETLKHKVKKHKNELNKIIKLLHLKEECMKKFQDVETIINEFNKNETETSKIKTHREFKALTERNDEIKEKYTSTVNFIRSCFTSVLTQYPKLEEQINEWDKFVETHEKFMNRELRLCNVRMALNQLICKDVNLYVEFQKALKSIDISIIKSCINQLSERIKLYKNYNFKGFKDELNDILVEHVFKLNNHLNELKERHVFAIEEELLNKNISTQQDICTEIKMFWGGVSMLDELLNKVLLCYKELNEFNMTCEDHRHTKEEILQELANILILYKNQRHIYEEKEKVDKLKCDSIEVENEITQLESDNNYKIENIELLLSTVNEIITKVRNLNHFNDNRLQNEIQELNEMLRQERLKLETMQLQYETNDKDDDDLEIWEEELNEIAQLNPNLSLLSQIGLELGMILHKLRINKTNINLENIKSEFEDKLPLLKFIKSEENFENVYKNQLLQISEIISKELEDVSSCNVVEKLKIGSLRATYYYTEILDAVALKPGQVKVLNENISNCIADLDKLDVGSSGEPLRKTRKDIIKLFNGSLDLLHKMFPIKL